jgi:tetratricopeptide (TPR) repeat protein
MDAQANTREQQRVAEVVLLRSELQKHPNDAERWAKLGKAYLYADTASAIDAFDRATRLAPNVASHWKELGEAHWSNTADDPRAAQSSEAAFLNCLQRDPQRGDCDCSLGFVQHSQGKHTEALQSFKRAAEHGACEYRMAEELLELGELDQCIVIVRAQLARTPVRPGNFDKLYVLHELELRIALRRGDLAQSHASRQRLAEYAFGLSPEIAFNLGSTYAVSRPPQPTEAKQLLSRFVQSSCDDSQTAHDCDQCVVARDLLVQLAASNP